MKSNNKGIYQAILLGYICLSLPSQATEVSPINNVDGINSPGISLTYISLALNLSNFQNSIDLDSSAYQIELNTAFIRQRIELGCVYAFMYA